MDTLDYIFGPMGSWSWSETFGESQPVIGVSDAPVEVVTQGLPARCTGSSRLGSDFLANSPLRADDSRRRNFWARRPWMSPK